MYSIVHLITIFIVAILFVVMFRLQRKFFSSIYYSLSRRVFGNGITIRMMLIRTIMVLVYSFIVFVITENEGVTIIGVGLGSFLIVWPVLLNPSSFDLHKAGNYNEIVTHVNTRGWFLLFLSYISFVISMMLIALISANFGDYIFSAIEESFKAWIGSQLFLIVLFILTSGTSKFFEKLLEKDIFKREERIENYEEKKDINE